MGDTSFYGKGMTVDTSKVFTVVTQFVGSPLTEIKRFYVQGGKVIPNSQSTIANVTGNSITTAFCDAQKAAFGDNYTFKQHGGFSSMSSALSGGMTLVMSIWDDHYANMLWVSNFQCLNFQTKLFRELHCSQKSRSTRDIPSIHPLPSS
jgi:cellulose 1,4-beta-cellobiosidase